MIQATAKKTPAAVALMDVKRASPDGRTEIHLRYGCRSMPRWALWLVAKLLKAIRFQWDIDLVQRETTRLGRFYEPSAN